MEETTYSNLLRKLGLRKYYPSKLKLSDALCIRKTTEEKLTDLPWRIIQKLVMSDYRGRDDTVLKAFHQSSSSEEENDTFLHFLKNIDNTSDNTKEDCELSTLDVFVALFDCCDSFLKQVLAQKLFLCKLAIPFIYPQSSSQKMMASLWALRTIEVNGMPVTDIPLSVVTFLRLGKLPISKSKLMNDILNENNHHTFVNYHSHNGTVKRILSDGLVECSWYIKSSNEESRLPFTTMFLNLRGDASKFERQQKIICRISSVIVVLVTANDLAFKYLDNYKNIFESAKDVLLLLFTEDNQKKEHDHLVKNVGEEILGKTTIIPNRARNGDLKSDSQLTSDICKGLKKKLNVGDKKILENCFSITKEELVTVDEYAQDCLEGKKLAQNVIGPLLNEPTESRKKNFLPLQAHAWHEYSKLLKAQHRFIIKEGDLTLKEKTEQHTQKMKKLRKEQVLLYKNMSAPTKEFMNNLTQKKEYKFCLNWLKKELDKESAAKTKDLRVQYSKKWEECQTRKENLKDKSKFTDLFSAVEQLEEKLVAASIGVEHLFRELGQIYEAVHESSNVDDKGIKSKIEEIPCIAANLLLNGYSLELLDGDASSLPLTWIKAVFRSLKQLTDDQPIFVISVLGIQSSGKSTLLNTMFGLQFPVSAGKCTRGAFMQLIPVDKSTGFRYRYILVIDTEGLRAPEMATAKYDHDNELATFAVGLAKVTLINIKGENTAEIRDVLQIVVHAFLRMKAANRIMYSKRTCIFIHQNVSEANANVMNMRGRHKLLENLDEMTREAAESEDIADVTSFRHILNFDMQKHVWYLPDLWLGNPPMAPVNPCYSERVEALRKCLLDEGEEHFLKPLEIFTHINDIWKGILCENFVFSFRNTLEIVIYMRLEAKCTELICQMQDKVMTYMQENATKMMASCKNPDELNNTTSNLIDELSNIVTEEGNKNKNKLKQYFDEEENGEIAAQWQSTMLFSLANEGRKLKEEKEDHLHQMNASYQVKLLQSSDSSTYLDEIIKEAAELAYQVKDSNMSDEELRSKFDKIWTKFTENHQITASSEHVNIYFTVEKALTDYRKWPGMQEEMKNNDLRKPLSQTSLVEDTTIKDIIMNSFERKQYFPKVSRLTDGPIPALENARQHIHSQTIFILENADTCLNELCRSHEPFQSENVYILFHKLKENVDILRETLEKDTDCKLSLAYESKLAILVGHHALHRFEKAQEEYIKKYSVHAYLQDNYNSIYDIFKNKVKDSTEEVIAGELFCDQLEKIILHTMPGKIAMPLIGEILSDFSYNKYQLLVQILEDLANNENFNDYIKYILNTEVFARDWLYMVINRKMFSDENGFTKYCLKAKEQVNIILEDVLKSISESTESITSQHGTVHQWAEMVCQKLVKLPLTANHLKLVTDRLVSSYNNLQHIIVERLGTVNDRLNDIFEKQTAENMSWPEGEPWQVIMERLWGCPELCPFCNEPCSKTKAKHEGTHSCIQHAPKGIHGINWTSTREIDTSCCGFSIHARHEFTCAASNFKCRGSDKCTATGTENEWHKYREYKTYIPDWDIQPDATNSSSKYWMWFMAKFKNELRDHYKCKVSGIPVSWGDIKKEEALADLKTFVHITKGDSF